MWHFMALAAMHGVVAVGGLLLGTTALAQGAIGLPAEAFELVEPESAQRANTPSVSPRDQPEPASAATPAAAMPATVPRPTDFKAHPEHARVVDMVAAGRAAEAYEAMLPLEADYAGDASFDYLFGVACLDSGRPSRAVFSLQSVVAADRSFAGARLDLARAYFNAADYTDARHEFAIVAAMNPPADTAEVIGRYLAQLDRRQLAEERQFRVAVDVSAGLDSNANGGTASETFLGIPLDANSREVESPYYGLGARASYARLLSPRLRWQSAGLLRHREYPDATFVSTTLAQVSTGLSLGAGRRLLSVDATARQTQLDGERNQTLLALDLAGETQLSSTLGLAASLRLGDVSYPDEVAVQDVTQMLGGLSLRWRPAQADNRLELYAGPVLGVEDAADAQSSFGRDLTGARAGLNAYVRGSVLRASLTALSSEYDGAFLGGERKDDQTVGQLEVEIPGLFGRWMLRPSLIYVDNSSSLTLYEFDRLEAGLALVRSF